GRGKSTTWLAGALCPPRRRAADQSALSCLLLYESHLAAFIGAHKFAKRILAFVTAYPVGEGSPGRRGRPGSGYQAAGRWSWTFRLLRRIIEVAVARPFWWGGHQPRDFQPDHQT